MLKIYRKTALPESLFNKVAGMQLYFTPHFSVFIVNFEQIIAKIGIFSCSIVNGNTEAYLKPRGISTMKLFSKNS